jgi:hypothetical protein
MERYFYKELYLRLGFNRHVDTRKDLRICNKHRLETIDKNIEWKKKMEKK